MNTLYLDPRGCNHADMHYTGKSDVGNYRLVACVTTKQGEPIVIEFGEWARRESYTTKARNQKSRIVDDNCLHADGEHTVYNERPGNYYGPEAGTYGFNFEKQLDINPDNYHYTRNDLLRFVSDVSGREYTEIVFNGDEVDKQIDEIYKPVENALYAKARAAREELQRKRDAEIEAMKQEIRARKANA